MAGCQDKEAMAELEAMKAADNLPGFIFSEPAPNSDGKIKILVWYDMEGLSGIDDWRMTIFRYPEQYKKGQEFLTADVNAVIEGLFDGGADEIYVLDQHGSGSPGPDIILEQMDSRAKFIDEAPEEKGVWELEIFDAVAFVGMHSKTGGGGFMAHTGNPGMDPILNGRSVNETELAIISAGFFDVPMIFVSGDDKLKEQLEPYFWIEYVTVKYAKDAYNADLRPIDEVLQEMRMAAKEAVKNIPDARVVNLKTPIKAGLRAVPPADLSVLEGVPGVNFQDDAVTFEASDYEEAWKSIRTLKNVAYSGYDELKWEIVRKRDNHREIRNDWLHNLYIRWLDYESGRWKPSKK
jgi:D-amino peptidase